MLTLFKKSNSDLKGTLSIQNKTYNPSIITSDDVNKYNPKGQLVWSNSTIVANIYRYGSDL